MQRPPFAASIPLFAMLAICPTTPAVAQVCGLRNDFRLVTSVNNVPASIFGVNTGWVATGPLVTPGASQGSNPQGCLSTASCTASADYGRLRLVGAGSATTCSAGGVFLWLDEHQGGYPKAQFADQVTVASTVLPLGAPVQLRCIVNLSAFVQVTGASPFSTYTANLLCNGNVVVGVSNTTGMGTALVQTTVGATVNLGGRLFATIREQGVQAGPPNTGAFVVDLDAGFDIASTTPDVTLIYCSGGRYNLLTAGTQSAGIACGAAPPTLTASAPVLGTPCVLSVAGAPASQIVLLGLALGGPVSTPFGTCALQLDPATAMLHAIGASDPAGQWHTTFAIPPVTSIAGLLLTAQGVPLATGGPFLGIAELSNGLVLRLGF